MPLLNKGIYHMRAIFIVGTGRSGTHFMARLLNGYENVWDPLKGKEKPSILMDIAKAAIHHREPSASTVHYYREVLSQNTGVYLDQHHPNLFFVEKWSRLFDGCLFLYPTRPTVQVVASMLRHGGVMGWYRYAENWRRRLIDRVPYPNQFLGIASRSELSCLPVHLLCAHRVLAHQRTFFSTAEKMNASLRSVDYQSLVNDPYAELQNLFQESELQKLGRFQLVEKPKIESLSKYQDVLSETQISEIEALERETMCVL